MPPARNNLAARIDDMRPPILDNSIKNKQLFQLVEIHEELMYQQRLDDAEELRAFGMEAFGREAFYLAITRPMEEEEDDRKEKIAEKKAKEAAEAESKNEAQAAK